MPLRFVGNGSLNAIVLRRETPQLDDLVQKSIKLYPYFGATLDRTTGRWTFPSGARIWFTHCQHEWDVSRFDGHEFQLAVFDELTHFTEKQYKAIRARVRGTDPSLPMWTRATSNPGGVGHDWVFRRWQAWLNPEHPKAAAPGEVRWCSGDDESSSKLAQTRTFIPARRADNPHLPEEYAAQLADLDPVRREQLDKGNWLARPGKGLYFKKAWVRSWLDQIPDDTLERVRAWDFGATKDGDWTVGARISKTRFGAVVEDVERMRGTPAEVRECFGRTARRDKALDPSCVQWIPQDPGQAGIDQVQSYLRDFPDLIIRARRPTTDKITAFAPFSAHSEAGMIAWCKAPWNQVVIETLEAFPEGNHDDDCDALSLGYAILNQPSTEGEFHEDYYNL